MSPMTLQAWLQLKGWVGTGGEAKYAIQSGLVWVGGEIETRRRLKLSEGDEIAFGSFKGRVEHDDL